MADTLQRYAKGKQYRRGPTRAKLASAIITHTVVDEVEAFYVNARVKRENARIRREARLAKKQKPVSLAEMPWD